MGVEALTGEEREVYGGAKSWGSLRVLLLSRYAHFELMRNREHGRGLR